MTTWGPQTAPAAGWYPDPEQPAALRWWDGTTWTEQRAPGWQPPGPGPGVMGPTGYTDHSLDMLLPVNRDGFAIAAGYLALFSLFPNPLTSTAALVCGGVALRRMRTSGKLGRGRAWFGIILGGLSLGFFLFVMAVAASQPN